MFNRRAKRSQQLAIRIASVRINETVLSVFLEGVKIFVSDTRRWNSQSEYSYLKALWTVAYRVVVDVLITASDSENLGSFLNIGETISFSLGNCYVWLLLSNTE